MIILLLLRSPLYSPHFRFIISSELSAKEKFKFEDFRFRQTRGSWDQSSTTTADQNLQQCSSAISSTGWLLWTYVHPWWAGWYFFHLLLLCISTSFQVLVYAKLVERLFQHFQGFFLVFFESKNNILTRL